MKKLSDIKAELNKALLIRKRVADKSGIAGFINNAALNNKVENTSNKSRKN